MIKDVEFGSFIINILTSGMYPEPMDAMREYIQNSYDGIKRAEKAGFLKKNFGDVRITVNEAEREVSIWDNGIGISSSEALSRLLDIGASKKVLGEDAGFRGIGRLAGLAYADKVIFKTSYEGEAVETILTFDAALIKQHISPGNRNPISAVELMRKAARHREVDCDPAKRFFEVKLIGVDPEACPFLEREVVLSYLRQVAPVEFDSQAFTYAKAMVNPHLEKFGIRRSINISYEQKGGDPEPILKPYQTFHHAGKRKDNKVDVVDIETFGDIAENPKWVGWISKGRELPGVILDEEVRGIRFRMNNILIGDHTTMSRVFEKLAKSNIRFNGYYSGEIHIIDNGVVPNARRDYFEDTPAWRAVEAELLELATILGKRVRDNEAARNRPTSAVERDTDRTIEEVDAEAEEGFATEAHRNRAVEKLKAQEEKIEKAIASERTPEEREALRIKKEEAANKRAEIEEKWKALVDESALNRDERKILRLVLGSIDELLGPTVTKKVAHEVNKRLKRKKKKA